MTTTWAQWPFTALFAALALFSAIRLLAARYGDLSGGEERGLDVARGVMSVGMVAMMVPRIDPLPRVCWQVIFGVAAAHIVIRLVKRSVRADPAPDAGPCGQHEWHLVIGGVAMVYMLAVMPMGRAMTGGMDMAAMSPAGLNSTGLALPVLTWAFIGYFLLFAVRLGTRLAVPVPVGAGGPRGVVISPHLLGCAEVVMGIGMSYMLITML